MRGSEDGGLVLAGRFCIVRDTSTDKNAVTRDSAMRFQWRAEWITPRLVSAVGRAVLEWTMIDEELTRTCVTFWNEEHPGRSIPWPFEPRVEKLESYVRKLLATEPTELRQFGWLIQRLRKANSRRNDIVHGRPGVIGENRDEGFEGIYVPHPSAPRYVPLTVAELETYCEELRMLGIETRETARGIWAADTASSSTKGSWSDVGGVWTKLTWENRPRIPQWDWNRPPEEFTY